MSSFGSSFLARSSQDLKSGEGSGAVGGLSREQVRAWAREAGFDEAGLVALPHAEEDRDAMRFEEWLRAGRGGTMRYLERADDEGRLMRARVGTAFPWARSAIVCFQSYESAQPHSTEPAAEGAGWIARYAWSGRVDANGARRPSDYHKVLLKRIKALEGRIRDALVRGVFGEFEARGYVDTGPVVERALATAAGLGWTGKNTCLIHPRLGSFGFLAVLLTSLELKDEHASAPLPDRCGSCRRCLDACPTNALIAPYQMDATRCISYLTIEHRGAIESGLMEGMGRQVFGCDICQDVCPWNRKPVLNFDPASADPELDARMELVNPALEWLAGMDQAEFELRFNGSPVRRTGFLGLSRNVAIAMGNSGQGRFAVWLEQWAKAADEGLRTAARWALERLGRDANRPDKMDKPGESGEPDKPSGRRSTAR
jgi:epoxyqueuosine reductase